MKYYIILLKYMKPIEEIDRLLAEHRNYLDSGYQKGILLMSGPLEPREGGVLVAKSSGLEEIREFCHQDPFYLNGCTDYHFIEFHPVKHREELKAWIG
ncbi:MAG: GTP cyclohydrolase [Leptospiraceae bacterium]|nr:GTP cyclohydrolase [Leptospiraceae bacterium]MCP5511650.1 GTP cyclohydrolase [Leptospiraceae bacterium]